MHHRSYDWGDTTRCGQQADGTHPTGMLSCYVGKFKRHSSSASDSESEASN